MSRRSDDVLTRTTPPEPSYCGCTGGRSRASCGCDARIAHSLETEEALQMHFMTHSCLAHFIAPLGVSRSTISTATFPSLVGHFFNRGTLPHFSSRPYSYRETFLLPGPNISLTGHSYDQTVLLPWDIPLTGYSPYRTFL